MEGIGESAVEEWVTNVSENMATKLPNEDEIQAGSLTPDQRTLLLNTLRSLPEIFLKTDQPLPYTQTGTTHQINAGDTAPILERRFRMSHGQDEIIRQEIISMLQGGIIEPGSGPWGFQRYW